MERIGNGLAGIQNMVRFAQESRRSGGTPQKITKDQFISAAQEKGVFSVIWDFLCCCFKKPFETLDEQKKMESRSASSFYNALQKMGDEADKLTFTLSCSEDGYDSRDVDVTIWARGAHMDQLMFSPAPEPDDNNKIQLADNFSLADLKGLVDSAVNRGWPQ